MNRGRSGHLVGALLIASTALVAACSYDWDIGSGPPSELVAAPASSATAQADGGGALATSSEAGAAADSGATPVVKVEECGAGCKCEDANNCEFACPKGAFCRVTCKDNSTCKLACPEGTTCTLACEDNAKCNMDCSAGTNCTFAGESRAVCGGTCGRGAFCRYDRNECDVTCDPSAYCLR